MAKKVKELTSAKVFKGNILQGNYDEAFLKKTGQLDRTVARKMRYWCYKLHHAEVGGKKNPNIPKGLKTFVEKLKGFGGWSKFAISWDIHGHNPFIIVIRLTSVWEDWDHVMNRVAIPINTSPEEVARRVEALSNEYARKEAKHK